MELTREPRTAPVFLLGLPRSGTTLLSYLLNTHPDITVPPEPWLMLALEGLGEVSPRNPANSIYLGQAFREFTSGCDLVRAKRALAQSLYGDHLRMQGKSVLVDKTPRYWLKLKNIHQMFPDSHYIWLKRNPFAILASMKTTYKFDIIGGMKAGGDYLYLFDLLLGSRALLEFAAQKPTHLSVLRYEDLVVAPIETANRLFEFLDVPPFTISLDIEAQNTTFAKSELGDKRILGTNSIRRDGNDTWQSILTADEVQALYLLLGFELICDLGYQDAADTARAIAETQQPLPEAHFKSEIIEAAFRGRTEDIERFSNPAAFNSITNIAVQCAYERPRDVLQAIGLL